MSGPRQSVCGFGFCRSGFVDVRSHPKRTCRQRQAIGILSFSLVLVMMANDEFDPLAPQREAAFFYGLFLRGHDVEALRQDIAVPRAMFDKWLKARAFEAN